MYLPVYPKQAEFLDSQALYRAFIGGRGSGKSWVACYDLIRRARRGRTYLVASPTYPMLFDSELRSFEQIIRQMRSADGRLLLLDLKKSAPASARLRNGAEILFRSADDPERLRGPNLSGAVLMEAALMHRDAYDIAIACLRENGEQGWLTIATTPRGPSHWTADVFGTRDGPGHRPDTHLVRASTGENPFNPEGFEAQLQRQYGDTQWAKQELGGEFVAIEGAVFPPEWFEFPGFFVSDFPEGGITHEVLYLDPSQGKDSKVGDYQAYVRAAFWPGPRHENLIYLDCHAAKEPPPDMIARGIRLCRTRKPDVWAYEVNGTMGLLAAEIDRQLRVANMLQRTAQVTHTAAEPKRQRIRNTLMPYLAKRQIRILDTRGGRLLRAQLGDEPFSEHDDCSDAAAGAVAELEQLVQT